MIYVHRHLGRKAVAAPSALGRGNRSFKLSEEDKDHMAIMKSFGLWPDRAIARTFGVSADMPMRNMRYRTVSDSPTPPVRT